MYILTALLLGVATNLDNLFVGLSFGLRGRRISILSNIVIGLLSATATLLCCFFASLLSGLGGALRYVGGGVIIIVGIMSFFQRDDGEESEKDGKMTARDTLILGLALAANCLAVAFGAGLTGIGPVAAAVAVGSGSILTVGLGNRLGLATGKRINQRLLTDISGGVMIALGLIQLLA